MAIFEDLLATEDDFAWLKRPDFIWRDGPDDEVRIRSDSFCLNGSPTLNRFLQQWHIDLLELALHKRCLTSALSGPRETRTARRRRDNGPRACGAPPAALHGPLQRIVRHHIRPVKIRLE